MQRIRDTTILDGLSRAVYCDLATHFIRVDRCVGYVCVLSITGITAALAHNPNPYYTQFTSASHDGSVILWNYNAEGRDAPESAVTSVRIKEENEGAQRASQ